MKSCSLALVAGLASLVTSALPSAWGQYWEVGAAIAPVIEADGSRLGDFNTLVAYPGGKLLVTSRNSIVNGVVCTDQLIRLNADGSLDTTFQRSTRTQARRCYSDGRILVATSVTGRAPFVIKRLLANGSVDTTFNGPSVNASSGDMIGVEFLADGRILIYGDFRTVNGGGATGVSLLNLDGTVDPTFTSPLIGASSSNIVNHATQAADGKILVAGEFFERGSGAIEPMQLVRIDLNGAIDRSFNVANTLFSSGPSRLYPLFNGTILVVDGSNKLLRITSTGALDATFAPALQGDVFDFGAQKTDGKIFYTSSVTVGSISSHQLRLMNPDGTDDPSFPAISTPRYGAYGLGLPVLCEDGTYFEGSLTPQRFASNLAISHVLLNGDIDMIFNPRFSRAAAIDAYARQPDGKYLVAGSFGYINNVGLPQAYDIARLNADGAIEATFLFTQAGYVNRLYLQPGGKIVAVGGFPDGNGINKSAIRLNANGSIDPSFNAITQDCYLSAIDNSGFLYLYGGSDRPQLRRFTLDGLPDASFQAAVLDGNVSLIAPLNDGSLLVYFYSDLVGDSLVRLLPDGTLDNNFIPPNLRRVIALAGLPGGGALVCERFNVGFAMCYSIRRLESDGRSTYNYITDINHEEFITTATMLSMAGSIFDVLRSAAGVNAAQVAIELGKQTTLICTTNGEFVHREPGNLGGAFQRYFRTSLVSPSVDTAPVLVQFSTLDFGYELGSTYFTPVPVVSGLGPFTYQWRKNGVAIPGANSLGFSIESVNASDVGDYSVVISNASGSVSSPVNKLAIAAAPAVTTQPLSHASFVGDSLSLFCAVSGVPAPTYQWQKGGINIPGATNSTLTLNNIQLSDAGSYGLIATNSKGSVTSRFSRLVVLLPQQNAITYATTRASTGVTAGGIVNFDYFVTNVGTKTWGAKHYLSIRDTNNTFVAFSSLIGILPGETTTANLNFPAPTTPGTYTYYVQGLEDGVEFFSTQTTVVLTVLAPVTDAITYNTTSFPVSAAPGSSVIFTYNVTNTGTAEWGTNYLLALKEGAYKISTTPLTVLAPGASKTVNLSFTVPSTPGTYHYSVQAFQSLVSNFGTQANLTLIALAPQPNAIVYNRVRYPDSVVPGAVLNLKYTLSNAGTQAWGAGHYISLRDSAEAYLAFIPLAGTAAGGTKTVEFTLTAPTAPGTYTYYVQALEDGIEFFSTQDVVIVKVVALPLGNAVSYNTSTIPITATPGATVNFTANVTNRGTRTWGTTHYLSFRDVDNTFLAFPSLNGVAPGASRTSNLSFTAPTTPGIYTYTLQAFEDGVSFFEMADTVVLLVQ